MRLLNGMSSSHTDKLEIQKQLTVAIAWCLAWGEGTEPEHSDVVEQMRQASQTHQPLPDSAQPFLAQAQQLDKLTFPNQISDLTALVHDHENLWNTRIGLVYGGATKIKQYVFEAAKLPDIRGASALLDRINLEDIPSFFHHSNGSTDTAGWLEDHFPGLRTALIPELLVYSSGGSILAFCPAAWVDSLADAIEKRYTDETLTANSCAVGARFRPLEIRFGLLQDPVEDTLWLDQLRTDWITNPVMRAYFDLPEPTDKEGNPTDPGLSAAFRNRKNFNELVGKLANQFNLRRSGFNATTNRPSRRYPPMLETHPYLKRDDSDRSSAVLQVTELPSQPWVSEPLARKRRIGEIAKQETAAERGWYARIDPTWEILAPQSWVQKFEAFLRRKQQVEQYDPNHRIFDEKQEVRTIREREARSLREISDASDGFVAYIYADGNNMGQYIRDHIKTPQEYKQFSEDIFEATEQSVYYALAHHLEPHYYTPNAQDNRNRSAWIHPFEIVTIGGDDVLLIVPANKGLEIAKCIGETFEDILSRKTNPGGRKRYGITEAANELPKSPLKTRIHRYKSHQAISHDCCLSISSGVLITADNTPIYYADKLVSQLLKSAKKQAKDLKPGGYYGGTIDFLTLKAVTMISSNIKAFRKEGLTINRPGQQLKLYAAPYTLHELGGLLETVKALKQAKFPRSQLYQIRSLLERGKRTAILNYRYFRVRLSQENQRLLQENLEIWCEPRSNNGNLAPWITPEQENDQTIYETFWRELVELYPFVDAPEAQSTRSSSTVDFVEATQ